VLGLWGLFGLELFDFGLGLSGVLGCAWVVSVWCHARSVASGSMESEDEFAAVTEVLRIAVGIATLALTLYMTWDYVKDRPEWTVTKRRISLWWDKFTMAPQRLKRMENETVFEAMEVVTAEVDDAGA
jgi:hypothetical protein